MVSALSPTDSSEVKLSCSVEYCAGLLSAELSEVEMEGNKTGCSRARILNPRIAERSIRLVVDAAGSESHVAAGSPEKRAVERLKP